MMNETSSFSSTPILLQPPTMISSSLTMDDQFNQHIAAESNSLTNMYYVPSSTAYDQYSLQQNDNGDDDGDDIIMDVPQHLELEQIEYEFPPRSLLRALAHLDRLGEADSFFDETSFTSLTNDSSSSSSSVSILSGYSDHHQQDDTSSTTTPLDHINCSTFFSSLTDEKENVLDLTRTHPHHMLTEHQQQRSYHPSSYSSSSYTSFSYHHGIQEDERSAPSLLVVDDNRLSPLLLPAQAAHLLQREQSYESTSTITKNAMVAPRSFLTIPEYKSNNADPSVFVPPTTMPGQSRLNSLESVDLPIIISETEPIQEQNSDDGNSLTSDDLYPPQQVVIIRLSKRNMHHEKRCRTPLTYLATDEGYDDNVLDGSGKLDCEIESASVFLPLEDDEDDSGDMITPPSTSVSGNGLWESFQQQQHQWTQRIQRLEQQLDEERAMRQAFEKAMEDVTVLMDQQQKVLYDRLEQEINMRQAYEHKMQQTLAHVEPLECRLEKETASRIQLEETMVHVLDQLELLQSQQRQHTKNDTLQHDRSQKILDKALDDISDLSTKVVALEIAPTSSASASASASTLAPSRKTQNIPAKTSRHHVSSTSTATTAMSSKTNTNRMKQAARSNATSFNHAAIASGTTANTNPPRSRATATTSSAASTKTNKPKTSIVPTSASVSRRSKFPGSSRSTKTPTIKNSGTSGSGNSGPDSHSSSRRVVYHR